MFVTILQNSTFKSFLLRPPLSTEWCNVSVLSKIIANYCWWVAGLGSRGGHGYKKPKMTVAYSDLSYYTIHSFVDPSNDDDVFLCILCGSIMLPISSFAVNGQDSILRPLEGFITWT